MKKLLAVVTLFISIIGKAQNDTTFLNGKSLKDSFSILTMGTTFVSVRFGEDGNYVMQSLNDNNIEIQGDTIKAIRNLLTIIHQKDSTEAELWKMIITGIDFANQVPDVWKMQVNNCKWLPYIALLNKQGFRETKVKPTKKKPCR